ncbi:glutamyl-tRNA(Gln) amidotransferase subunit A, mitochondrial [Ischnura elegans]|uniref:glutamyl-tRNA(Gln) amidotransferase subunit A, mitochondrial n=1 Tax=Ischnura elegans TaxID=197161 RepID=UPI001ED87AEC|nr:glutamyl-tRNA(Gln) amidotransferase subunit A, mitochondrial [Ischnura elegans]
MLSLTIKQVAEKLRQKQLDVVELCEACLERAKKIQNLNAFVCLTEDSFREQSLKSRERILKGKDASILDGISVAVKDNFCTRNIPTTCASQMLKNFTPTYNATVVEKLKNAGAILIGKTNMDEFAMGSGTVDSIHGPTKNIWQSHLEYKLEQKGPGGETVTLSPNDVSRGSKAFSEGDWLIAGGSSGGSAVAVASGVCFAALGSDTGGSTRNPAAYCGVIGLKPSYGLVSRYGLIPLVHSMDVPGILARSVDDAASCLGVLAGHDHKDPTSVDVPLEGILQEVGKEPSSGLSGVRIGIPKEYHCPGMSPDVVDTWKEVADALSRGGAEVEEVSLPHTKYSVACYSVLNQCEVASNMACYDGIEFGIRSAENISTEEMIASSRRMGFNEVVRGRILAGNYFLLKRNYQKYFEKALKIRHLITKDFENVWDSGMNFLLTPVTLGVSPRFSEFSTKDNREQCATQDYCTQPVNMAGCPAISIPIKLSSEGLPLSLQLIGRIYDDGNLLKVAKWIEDAVNFPRLVMD